MLTTSDSFEPSLEDIQLPPLFYGSGSKNPYAHVMKIEARLHLCFDRDMLCADSTYLRFFPMSLQLDAKFWFDSLPLTSFSTWWELQTNFLKTFFPCFARCSLPREALSLLVDLIDDDPCESSSRS